VKCPDPAYNWFLLFVFLSVAIAFFSYLVIQASKGKSLVSVALKVILNHLQVLAFLGDYNVRWPETMHRLFQTGGATTVDSQMYSINCALGTGFYDVLLLFIFLPVIVCGFMAMGYAFLYYWDSLKETECQKYIGDRKRLYNSLTRSILIVLYVLHAGIAHKVIQVWNCREIEGISVLVSDVSVRCYTNRWWGYATFCVVYLFLYIIGSIFVILYFLHHNKAKFGFDTSQSHAAKKYQFMYYGYRFTRYYWEIIIMARKLLVVAIAVFFGVGLQVFFGVVIMYTSVMFHSLYHPFEDTRIQFLETVSLWTLLVTLVSSLAFSTNELAVEAEDFVTVCVLLLNLTFLSYGCYRVYVLQKESSEWIRNMLKKVKDTEIVSKMSAFTRHPRFQSLRSSKSTNSTRTSATGEPTCHPVVEMQQISGRGSQAEPGRPALVKIDQLSSQNAPGHYLFGLLD